MAQAHDVPHVDETEIDREDLIDAAKELGVDEHASLDDQELFVKLARRLGELDEASRGGPNGQASAGGDGADERAAKEPSAARSGERIEDRLREHVTPVLDREVGPLALRVLGLEIHLHRVHAVLTANPGPRWALLGKLLSGVAATTGQGRLEDAVSCGGSMLDRLGSAARGMVSIPRDAARAVRARS